MITRTLLRQLNINKLNYFTRTKSAKVESIILEKCLEGPAVTFSEENDVDLIGPPDPVSNLRPVVRKRSIAETKLQEQLRVLQDATQKWNQDFWFQHNSKFMKEKQEFIKQNTFGKEKDFNLTADEMSNFYKKFLDEHWKIHLNYNFEWYKKNFNLLYLAFIVHMEHIMLRTVNR